VDSAEILSFCPSITLGQKLFFSLKEKSVIIINVSVEISGKM
jgi:hypothetical protein